MFLFLFIFILVFILTVFIGKLFFSAWKNKKKILIKIPLFITNVFLIGILLFSLSIIFSLWDLNNSLKSPCNQCNEKEMMCSSSFNIETNLSGELCDFQNTKNCACCDCFTKLDCIDCFFFWDKIAHCDTNTGKCYPGW